MADTLTANYDLVKPEIGASDDTWGNKSNGNWDIIDTELKAVSDAADDAAADASAAAASAATAASNISTLAAAALLKADNLSGLANKATARINLDLVIGTHVQAYSAMLASMAELAWAADKIAYSTGASAVALTDFTSIGRSIVGAASAAAVRTLIGAPSTSDPPGTNSVGQTQLKTTTATQTTSVDTENSFVHAGSVALSGGSYTMGIQCRRGSGSHANSRHAYSLGNIIVGGSLSVDDSINSTTLISRVQHYARTGNGDNNTYTCVTDTVERYVQSSPPYAWEGSEAGAFVYGLIEKGSGKIKALSIANDPIWVNNGPTSLTPDRIDSKTGKRYRRIRVNMPVLRKDKVMANDIAKLKRALDDPEFEWVEVTDQMKHVDMRHVPHPFIIADELPGNLIPVMLDPCSKLAMRIASWMNCADADEYPCALFMNDYIRFSNEDLAGRTKPCKGMLILAGDFK